jgi:hypothetical protein
MYVDKFTSGWREYIFCLSVNTSTWIMQEKISLSQPNSKNVNLWYGSMELQQRQHLIA